MKQEDAGQKLINIANALNDRDMYASDDDYEEDFGPDDMVEDIFGTMVPGATMVNVSSTEELPAYQAANYGIPFVAPGTLCQYN